ncbi:hypothetical protein [Streptomyces sp. NPDC048442]|uniref:hypothetical protein n=1 Tax=Streptomyces sp. NPDC048442 TaxID=3154823 RepID=UPI00343C80C4
MSLDGTLPGPGGGPAAPFGPSGGLPNMASSPAKKRAAANALQQHIEPDTRKAGDHADQETGSAVKAFDAKDGHGWLTSAALKKANKAWETQVKGLLSRLGSDRTSLRSTNLLLSGTDLGVGGDIRPPSAIDKL